MAQGKKDIELLREAKERFALCKSFEDQFQMRARNDIKFAHGDSDNMWQWDGTLAKARQSDGRPALTINKTRQHNLQIINDIKQNKVAAKIIPVNGEASYESAQVFDGLVRHIEYHSNAEDHYEHGLANAVECGIGYWRVLTDYVDDNSFEQEIFIRGIQDPLSVYLDPDIQEPDGSDARFGFIFKQMPKEEYKRLYPNREAVSLELPFDGLNSWVDDKHVMVAEYYYAYYEKDTLFGLPDGSIVLKSQIKDDKALLDIIKLEELPSRPLEKRRIGYCKIIGDEIAEKSDWAGKYVPIVRCYGEEIIVEGQLDRKGHTRYLKDPARLYNYWTSAAAEFVALQGKAPYLAPVRAVEGYEDYWKNANVANYSFLPYNDVDSDGNPVTPPQRQQPPVMAPAYIQGMQVASEELKMASGQYDNSMGKAENESSGVAIHLRQAQGDRATYHFIDNYARAIRFTGKILIDLIPKIYDTRRVLRIIGEDGKEGRVTIDPDSPQALAEQQVENQENEKVEQIFNPSVGLYDVRADVGPAYGTRRREAFAAISNIAAQNPQVMGLAGDLLFRAADFPLADELAQRMSKTIPAEIKGDGPSPEVMQMMQQMEQMQAMNVQLMQQLASEKREKDIDAYKAETGRIDVLKDMLSPEVLAPMIAQLVIETLNTQVSEQNTGQESDMPTGGGLPPV